MTKNDQKYVKVDSKKRIRSRLWSRTVSLGKHCGVLVINLEY